MNCLDKGNAIPTPANTDPAQDHGRHRLIVLTDMGADNRSTLDFYFPYRLINHQVKYAENSGCVSTAFCAAEGGEKRFHTGLGRTRVEQHCCCLKNFRLVRENPSIEGTENPVYCPQIEGKQENESDDH